MADGHYRARAGTRYGVGKARRIRAGCAVGIQVNTGGAEQQGITRFDVGQAQHQLADRVADLDGVDASREQRRGRARVLGEGHRVARGIDVDRVINTGNGDGRNGDVGIFGSVIRDIGEIICARVVCIRDIGKGPVEL